MAILKLLHLLSAVIWVGGMFFAYVILRPAAVDVLQPPERLRLWRNVFQRFFVWVWAVVGLILVSGLGMLHSYGDSAPLYVHVMLGGGILMVLIYAYVYFSLYKSLARGVLAEEWKTAGGVLGQIRRWVGINLTLGLLITGLAAAAPYLG
ncbi:MAG: CopD family protein [Gallionella sp.]|jgi:uncharacterized membrane protein|nr:CopD family protein [Gallionella sp.]